MSFSFKCFTLQQDHCAMKVGTDGVLLGAWASGGCRILDVGTGTGLIAMMMAQRFPDALVDAIDIDADACMQALQNIADSPFSLRVKTYHSSLQSFLAENSYDSIVCNPPFFENSLKNPDEKRTLARHTDSLSCRDLFKCICRMLADDGKFSIIIPEDRTDYLISESCISGLYMSRSCKIKTTVKKQPKRSMLEFSKKKPSVVEQVVECMQNSDGSRSDWYKKLTDDFYL